MSWLSHVLDTFKPNSAFINTILDQFAVWQGNVNANGNTLSNLADVTSAGGTSAFGVSGTWTVTDASGAGLVFTGVNCTYTKIGKLVFCVARFTYPATANGSLAQIGGLPFACNSAAAAGAAVAGSGGAAITALLMNPSSTTGYLLNSNGGVPTNAAMTGVLVEVSIVYMTP